MWGLGQKVDLDTVMKQADRMVREGKLVYDRIEEGDPVAGDFGFLTRPLNFMDGDTVAARACYEIGRVLRPATAAPAGVEETSPLAEAVAWLYDVCELYEDEDLDPDDHLQVVTRAFMSSDCDDFCFFVCAITGWQPVMITWSIPNWGFGHHSAARAPDGRLVDVRGWTEEADIRKYFGIKKSVATSVVDNALDEPMDIHMGLESSGIANLVATISNLPHAPFDTPEWLRHSQFGHAKCPEGSIDGGNPCANPRISSMGGLVMSVSSFELMAALAVLAGVEVGAMFFFPYEERSRDITLAMEAGKAISAVGFDSACTDDGRISESKNRNCADYWYDGSLKYRVVSGTDYTVFSVGPDGVPTRRYIIPKSAEPVAATTLDLSGISEFAWFARHAALIAKPAHPPT